MPDQPLPLTFREEVFRQFIPPIQAGESCALVGVGSSGKSNIARHLARADVRQHYFGPHAARTVVVYLNCKPFADRPLHDLYLHALDQFERPLEELGGDFARLIASLRALWEEAQSNPALLTKRNLDKMLGHTTRGGAERIILTLDDCDDLFVKAPPGLFSDLRGLRDNYKTILVYLTLTRREPTFLRSETKEYEEFFELISPAGHIFPIPPYSETDGLGMIKRLADRQGIVFPDATARRLYELSGGHPGLLRTLFFAALGQPQEQRLQDVNRIAANADVEAECGKIWDSLEEEEQADLRRIAKGNAPTGDGLRRLERRGLISLSLTPSPSPKGRGEQDAPQFFSPVFEKFLHSITGAKTKGSKTSFEFPGSGWHVRVNGQLITSLTRVEHAILRRLVEKRGQAVSRAELIEAMKLAEHGEAPAEARGDPLRRLAHYVQQIKAKLGPAGHGIAPVGDGYEIGV